MSTDAADRQPSRTARVVGNAPVAGGWRLLRLQQPSLAAAALPGQRVALSTARGTLEAYVSHVRQDWIALLSPPLTAAMPLSVHAPVVIEALLGNGWRRTSTADPPVVVASGSGIGAALYLIERLDPAPRLVLLGSAGLPLPFRPAPSAYVIAGLPPAVIAAAPQVEARCIPSRIADTQGHPGCFEGSAGALFTLWLAAHPCAGLDVFACLPEEPTSALRQPGVRLHLPD